MTTTYTYTIINDPGMTNTNAEGINDLGQVVGVAYNGQANVGFIDSNGTYTTVSYPGAAVTYAYGINNSGQIIGNYSASESSPAQAFLDPTSTPIKKKQRLLRRL